MGNVGTNEGNGSVLGCKSLFRRSSVTATQRSRTKGLELELRKLSTRMYKDIRVFQNS